MDAKPAENAQSVSNSYSNLVWVSLKWKQMISLVWKKRLFFDVERKLFIEELIGYFLSIKDRIETL